MVFHNVCGENIKFSDNKHAAERIGTSYDHGVIFSQQPLNVNSEEIFLLKIQAIEEKWAGSLRIGVTTNNPNNITSCRSVTDLFRKEEFKHSVWVWSGDRLFHNSVETPLKLNLHSLVCNDIVGLQLKSNGELHLFHHTNDIGAAITDLPVKNNMFYVIADVYGATRKVAYTSRVSSLQELCKRSIRQNILYQDLTELPLPRRLLEFIKE